MDLTLIMDLEPNDHKQLPIAFWSSKSKLISSFPQLHGEAVSVRVGVKNTAA